MPNVPSRPDLGQLRHQARDLLRAARAGDPAAGGRIRAVSEQMTLAAAQLAVAREYGFASWPRLKAQVETLDLAQKVDAFLEASIRDWTGRAARLLASTPEIAGHDFRTAVVLGDAGRVQEMLRRDPGLATRPDPRSGWAPLHAVAASRWHRLDPARAGGLVAVARLLLDAGADPAARTGGPRSDWTPLRCAVAGAANPAITRLLLEHGAVPGDPDLYLACFGDDDHESLRLLLGHATDVDQTTALAAPISVGDTEGARLLLEAGADPNHLPPADLYRGNHADDPPWPAVYAAVRSGAPLELVELLLDHGADPDAPGPDGRSPYRLALSEGRTDLADLLRRRGAGDDATATDRFLAACLRADRAEAQRLLAADPGLRAWLAGAEADAFVHAAETGSTAAVELMLDLGAAVGARGGDGGTALHAAAYSGSAAIVRLLLDRGADIEARDTTWDSPPLEWAMVGSGERPATSPSPDWIATVQALLDAGASRQGITLSPDDPKPPSAEVAQLLRNYGIGVRAPDGGRSTGQAP
jgi:ankyrin repeat protein